MSNIDAAAIRGALKSESASRIARLDVFPEIDSTNAWLIRQSAPEPGMFRAAIADHQTAGRGRGGSRWLSAPGSSLCLSLAHTFRNRLDNVSALSLAVGVAAVYALRDAGAADVKLKWPNDIVAGDRKLGGMLAETHDGSGSNTGVVVGIGINLRLPPDILASVDSDWAASPVDLENVLARSVSRDSLAAAMIGRVVESLLTFEEQGLRAFADTWRRYDWLRGRTVTVQQPGGPIRGTASGIDDDGALLVKQASATTRVISGSILLDGSGGAAS